MHRGRRTTILAAVLVVGGLVAGVAIIAGPSDSERKGGSDGDAGEDGEFGSPISSYDTRDRPALDFPLHVRSEDDVINRFVEDFYRCCYFGEYEKFRMMTSSRVTAMAPERFKRAQTVVEMIQIDAVDKIPEATDVPPPIYLVQLRVHFRPTVRRVDRMKKAAILIFKEAGRWVMAPAPKSLREDLDYLFEEQEAPPQEGAPKDAAGDAAHRAAGGST